MDKICLMTFGCSLNSADSERIAAVLKLHNFEIVESEDDASLIIINSCAVKGPTESKFFTLLEKLKEKKRKVIITGCIAQALPEKLREYSKCGPDQIDAIGDIVDETLAGNIVSNIVMEKKNKLKLPSVRKKQFIEIIPISQGCLGECSYCIVRLARGRLHSYPIQDTIEAARKAVLAGAKEIWLTSQDCGCYGMDSGTSLPALLDAISEIEGDFMVRVGMMNPGHLLRILKPVIAAFMRPKIYKFLHIPVQSGNNYVLADMNRNYHVEDYYHIVNLFRRAMPDITVSTDIIVGYPTEKGEFFLDTIRLVKESAPDVLNISRYWPRPKTKSFGLKQISGEIIKDRCIRLKSAFEWAQHESSKRWIGWTGKVAILEKGQGDTYIARNTSYRTIVLSGAIELGKQYNIKVVGTTRHDLVGTLID